MRLTAEVFQQISQQLSGYGASKRDIADRTEPRVGLRAWAHVLPELCDDTGQGKPIKVTITDIAWGGVGLVLPVKLPHGGTFVLFLPRDGTGVDTPLLIRYSVMHCLPLASSTLYRVGAKVIEVFDAPPIRSAPAPHAAAEMPRLSDTLRQFALHGISSEAA
ncbi:MAG: hypothetical protein AAGD32_11785 [Planctomycetota bacterium]